MYSAPAVGRVLSYKKFLTRNLPEIFCVSTVPPQRRKQALAGVEPARSNDHKIMYSDEQSGNLFKATDEVVTRVFTALCH